MGNLRKSYREWQKIHEFRRKSWNEVSNTIESQEISKTIRESEKIWEEFRKSKQNLQNPFDFWISEAHAKVKRKTAQMVTLGPGFGQATPANCEQRIANPSSAGRTANFPDNVRWPRPANSELRQNYCQGHGQRRANFSKSLVNSFQANKTKSNFQ